MTAVALPVQLLRFAVVGGGATATHVALGLGLAEGLGLAPFWANLAAFSAAVLVSYFGNLTWTFRMGPAGLGRLPRFLLLALAGLAANQLIVFALVDLAGWPYRAALAVVVLAVPALSFLGSRFWVFNASGAKDPARMA